MVPDALELHVSFDRVNTFSHANVIQDDVYKQIYMSNSVYTCCHTNDQSSFLQVGYCSGYFEYGTLLGNPFYGIKSISAAGLDESGG